MARRRRHEEPENHERWLVSYADFITLLFAFFVVMYSTSSVNEGKMRVLSDSLVASFAGRNKSLAPIQIGSLTRSPYTDSTNPLTAPVQFIIVAPPEGLPPQDQDLDGELADAEDGFLGPLERSAEPNAENGQDGELPDPTAAAPDPTAALPDPSAPSPEQQTELADVSDVAESVRESMSPLIDLAEVAIKAKKSWIEIELDSAKLFVSGSARLAKRAIPILNDLADVLKTFDNPIQVEGFTDNIPIRTLAFPSNWELSAARAASVVHLFTKVGIDPERMVAIGYGQHRPVANNATPEGRAKNRRVVLVIPADNEIRRILDGHSRVGVQPGGS